jgi:hypothetical protein
VQLSHRSWRMFPPAEDRATERQEPPGQKSRRQDQRRPSVYVRVGLTWHGNASPTLGGHFEEHVRNLGYQQPNDP